VFASVLILSLSVIGLFSFTRLGVDRFPKIDFPTILVTTVQPGAAPEQVETEITDKIEEAVNTISGIDDLRSVSSEGISQVIISFVLEKETDVAAQEVRDKLNGVLPRLPKTIQQLRVDKMDPDAAPVLSLALSAKQPVRDITEYADKVLRRQLESVNGEAEPDTLANVDGIGTVLLHVRRQSGTNTVEVVRAVKDRLTGLKAALPSGYTMRVVRDTSDFIEAAIHNVEEHLVVGSILAA